MKSGRSIFLDLFLNFIVNCFLFAVYDFFYTFSVSIFTSNLSCYCNCLEIVFLTYSHSDKSLSDLTDLFSLSFCCHDLSVMKKVCNLISEKCFSLVRCSA